MGDICQFLFLLVDVLIAQLSLLSILALPCLLSYLVKRIRKRDCNTLLACFNQLVSLLGGEINQSNFIRRGALVNVIRLAINSG